jgi:hypothetical protein
MSKLIDVIGQFTVIPNTVIEMIPMIGTDAFLVFTCLRYHSDDKGVSFPSYDTISKETTLNRHQISAGLTRLIDAGLLDKRRRFGNSTVYVLTMPSISAKFTLMDNPSVVPDLHHSSANSALSLVPNMHTNQIQLTRSIKPDPIDDDRFDELKNTLQEISGLPVTPTETPMINKWVKDGVESEDIKAHFQWRTEHNIKAVKYLSGLANGIETSRLIRIQGKAKADHPRKPVSTAIVVEKDWHP